MRRVAERRRDELGLRAVKVLLKLGEEPAVVERLLSRYSIRDNKDLFLEAACLLSENTGHTSFLDGILKKFLRDKDPLIQIEAARVYCKVGELPPEAVKILRGLKEDPAVSLQASSLLSLRNSLCKPVIRTLVNFLYDHEGEYGLKSEGENLLREIGWDHERVRKCLLHGVVNGNRKMREDCLWWLCNRGLLGNLQITQPGYASALVRLLKRTDWNLRLRVSELLENSELYHQEIVKALIPIIRNRYSKQFEEATLFLERIGRVDVVVANLGSFFGKRGSEIEKQHWQHARAARFLFNKQKRLLTSSLIGVLTTRRTRGSGNGSSK